METNEKTIQINPELFKVSSSKQSKKSKRNKTSKKGQSKRSHKQLEKRTNTLKKALIKKIQAHQERHRLKIEREQVRMKKENERVKAKAMTPKPQATSFEYLKKIQERVKERQQKVRKVRKSPDARLTENADKSGETREKREKLPPSIHTILKKGNTQTRKPISLGKHTLHTSSKPEPLTISMTNEAFDTPPKPSTPSKEPALSIREPISPVPERSTPVVLKEPPPYGILKGGTKPLYSSYRKTRKQQERLQSIQQRAHTHTLSSTHPPIRVKSPVSIVPNTPIDEEISPEVHARRTKLQKIKSMIKRHTKSQKNSPSTDSSGGSLASLPSLDNPPPISSISTPPVSILSRDDPPHTIASIDSSGNYTKKIRRTIRRKYQVGKMKTPKGSKVYLLVKNRKTRKKQLMENKEIQKTPILEVRKYLRERNLIRVGSQAPEHILRQLYEASRFSGDVENKSSDVLLHNYINTDGQTDGDLAPVSQTQMNYDVDTFLRELSGTPSTKTTAPGDTSALDTLLVHK